MQSLSISVLLFPSVGVAAAISSYFLLIKRKKRKAASDSDGSSAGENEVYNFYSAKNSVDSTSRDGAADGAIHPSASMFTQKKYKLPSATSNVGTLASDVDGSSSLEGLHLMEVHYTARSSTHTSLAPSLLELQILPQDLQSQHSWRSHPNLAGGWRLAGVGTENFLG